MLKWWTERQTGGQIHRWTERYMTDGRQADALVNELKVAHLGLSWPEIQECTTNVLGEAAGDKAVREAVARIEAMEDGALVPKTNYGNCGRKKSLPASTERKILESVKK